MMLMMTDTEQKKIPILFTEVAGENKTPPKPKPKANAPEAEFFLS